MKRSARRTSSRRSRLLASLALTALFVLLPGGVYAWGSRSSTFAVREVRVEGAERVSQERALGLLRDAFLGRNLFRIDERAVEEALRPLVFLASARVDRDFPSSLIVHVSEHTPALFVLAKRRWYLVSADGRVLALLGEEKRGVIVALRAGPPKASLKLPAVDAAAVLELRRRTSDPAVNTALRLLRILPAQLRQQLAVVRLKPSGLVLRLRSGTVAELGDTRLLRAKGLALHAVLQYYRTHHASASKVDVSVPDRPLAKPDL